MKDSKKYRDEIEQKLGRNLLLYQEIETRLKILSLMTNISGDLREFKLVMKQKADLIRKRTLGKVIEEFNNNVHPNFDPKKLELQDLSEPYFLFAFQFKLTNNSYWEYIEKELAEILEERNSTVHHFYQKYNLALTEDLVMAREYLEQQYKKAKPISQILKQFIEKIEKVKLYMVNDIEGCMWHILLKNNIVTKQLYEISIKKSREDGWVLFGYATKFAKSEIEIVEELKKAYGCKTLKAFVLKTELFEFKEEGTARGGKRLFYRNKSKDETEQWLRVQEITSNYIL